MNEEYDVQKNNGRSDMSEEFIRSWCEFGERRVYILMAIARRKHNEDLTHNSEIVHRVVLQDEDDVGRKYDDLRGMIARHDHTFRIYLTVNARNTVSAYFNFREQMNGWSQDLINGDDHAIEKMGKLDSYWKGTLHSPQTRDDSLFQFDVDDVTAEGIDVFTEELEEESEVVLCRETPNGYHVISEPFNYTEWSPSVVYDDLDTDGQLFVEECNAEDNNQ